MRRAFCFLLVLCVCFGALLSCAEAPETDERPLILTSNFPLYDFARVLIGDAARVEMLLPAGADAHSFEPTVQDVARLNTCTLFLYVSGEGEQHIQSMLDAAGEVPSMAFLDLVEPLCEEHEASEAHEGHIHEDEHIWTSPKNAMVMVRSLAERLSVEFPAEKESIRQNLSAYLEKLQALDADYETVSASLPLIVFGDRFPFAHLAADYNWSYLAAIEGCGEDTEPSAARLSEVIDAAKEAKIHTVFYTETSVGRVASILAAECSAQTARLHSCHNLTEEERAQNATYLSLMKQNLKLLQNA